MSIYIGYKPASTTPYPFEIDDQADLAAQSGGFDRVAGPFTSMVEAREAEPEIGREKLYGN